VEVRKGPLTSLLQGMEVIPRRGMMILRSANAHAELSMFDLLTQRLDFQQLISSSPSACTCPRPTSCLPGCFCHCLPVGSKRIRAENLISSHCASVSLKSSGHRLPNSIFCNTQRKYLIPSISNKCGSTSHSSIQAMLRALRYLTIHNHLSRSTATFTALRT
jgi:hypothetical protein